MYIWWMDESEHSSILKKRKKKHVQIVHSTYNMKELDDAGIRKLIKDWMKEEK